MIVLVDPGMASTNIGDQIISDAVHREFVAPLRAAGVEVETIPMHGQLSEESRARLRRADDVVVSGTNLLADHMRFRSPWQWATRDIELTRGKLTTFGVGWWQYQLGGVDPFSARWLRALSSGRPWAVRDEYSAARLRAAGVAAVHTSCPTLWGVERQALPSDESRVIATFTDYNQDPLADRRLVELLESRFAEVLYWPQGPGDERYIRSIVPGEPRLIPASLAAFDAELQRPSTAYVGLRLHGGIRAMQFGVPTLILSIDNRAREISRSVGLIAPSRHALGEIGALLAEPRPGELSIPREQIDDWRGQWTGTGTGTVAA
ncbi:MAG TPA: polysaccharide pyruvyl transferase family protein [Gryllotalpicola sp.]